MLASIFKFSYKCIHFGPPGNWYLFSSAYLLEGRLYSSMCEFLCFIIWVECHHVETWCPQKITGRWAAAERAEVNATLLQWIGDDYYSCCCTKITDGITNHPHVARMRPAPCISIRCRASSPSLLLISSTSVSLHSLQSLLLLPNITRSPLPS